MATKKQRRTAEVKHKKTKKNRKVLLLSVIVVVSVVFLAIFFITLFDYIYPPATGKQTASKKREKQEVTLFFSDANERFLVPEKRLIPRENEPEEQAKELVLALIAGSKTGLVNTFPEKVEILGIKKEEGEILSVDFRESLDLDAIKIHHGKNPLTLFRRRRRSDQFPIHHKRTAETDMSFKRFPLLAPDQNSDLLDRRQVGRQCIGQ